MSPKPDYFHGLNLRQDLVDQAMLNIDAPGIRSREISDQFLVRRRVLKRVLLEGFEKGLGLRPQPRGRQFLRVLLSLFGEDEPPAYQASFLESLPTGSLRPARIDSRMPGIERR